MRKMNEWISEIKNAKHFQDVIFMILVAGNFLNSVICLSLTDWHIDTLRDKLCWITNLCVQGGYAGDAIGVKLSSLQKIADIRGNQPGISLLNFISMVRLMLRICMPYFVAQLHRISI